MDRTEIKRRRKAEKLKKEFEKYKTYPPTEHPGTDFLSHFKRKEEQLRKMILKDLETYQKKNGSYFK